MSFKTAFLRDADAPIKNFGYNEGQDDIIEEVVEETIPEIAVASASIESTPPPDAPTVTTSENIEATKSPETVLYDWKKELKSVNKNDVYKELGLDDFTIEMLAYKEKAGDFNPYLEVKSVDYTQMDAEAILRLDMKKANPGISEKSLTFKFNKELNEKYYLDRDNYPDDSDEAIYGQEQLRLDSEQKRKELVDYQQKFKAPDQQPDLVATQREAAVQEAREKRGKEVLSNEYTVALNKTKSIQFGEGEESFTMPITDTDDVVDKAMFSLMNSDTDLKDVNLKEFYQVLAIGKDLKGFLNAYGGHQRALEHKKLQAEMQNITPKNDGTVAPPAAQRNYAYGER